MEQPGWVKQGIALGNALHFKKQRPVLHNALNLGLFAALLAGAGALLVASAHRASVGAAGGGVSSRRALVLADHPRGPRGLSRHAGGERGEGPRGPLESCARLGRLGAIGIDYREHWEKGHQVHHLHPLEEGDTQVANVSVGRALVAVVAKMLLIRASYSGGTRVGSTPRARGSLP